MNITLSNTEIQGSDSYMCDRCGDEYFFVDAYDEWKENGVTVYAISGWHGVCDGQEMCDNCWDAY